MCRRGQAEQRLSRSVRFIIHVLIVCETRPELNREVMPGLGHPWVRIMAIHDNPFPPPAGNYGVTMYTLPMPSQAPCGYYLFSCYMWAGNRLYAKMQGKEPPAKVNVTAIHNPPPFTSASSPPSLASSPVLAQCSRPEGLPLSCGHATAGKDKLYRTQRRCRR